MNNQATIIVYPVKDIAKAKSVFTALLGVEPYADSPYYVGYKAGDVEIGLDPNGSSNGPIAYWEVEDAKASLDALVAAGAEAKQEPKNVGGGLLIALAIDADGNTIGLRQQPV
jgi:predicted enzyme related to lactoylglutathione lyase